MKWCAALGLGLSILATSGCGGGDRESPTGQTAVRLQIQWGARRRAVAAPVSALSAKITLTGAASRGGDFTWTIDRNPARSDAHIQEIVSANQAKPGTWPLQIDFFAAGGATGDRVGTAAAAVTLAADGTGIGGIATEGRIASVRLPSAQRIAFAAVNEPKVICRSGSGQLIAVSPGSIRYRIVRGEDTLAQEVAGLRGRNPGEAIVTAAVDGHESAPTNVVVTGGSAADPAGTQLQPEVVLLPEDGTVTAALTGARLALTGNVPALQAGDVVVSRMGDGLIRRVRAVVRQSDDQVEAETDPCDLTRVFRQVIFSTSQAMTVDNSTVQEFVYPGNITRATTFQIGREFIVRRPLVGDSGAPSVTLDG